MALNAADSTWMAPVKGGRWGSVSSWTDAFAVEGQRLTVWSPLLLVLGIWGYFALSREPPLWLALPLGIACVVGVLSGRLVLAARVVAIIALGFAAAQLRAQWVATPLLRAYAPGQVISGYVADVDVRSRQRFTMVIAVRDTDKLPEAERPRRIFVTVTGKHKPPHVGDVVRMTADLAPLPRPAQPGAFDYGRQLYFQSIGAVGRSKTGVEVLAETPSWRFRASCF